MCGICGLAIPSGAEPPSPALLREMCRTIIHRGPDDEGIHTGPNVALGARRLSIIDLEGGHQPLANEDGTVWVAYNGEIYNFPELKAELEGRGHRFRTRTDTETIVHSYEEWGEDCVRRFRGMFAIALWDEKEQKLILIRDRIGVKPLYYALLDDNTLIFGSEIKAILAHSRVKRELDHEALDLFLTVEYVPSPLSIFKGIRKLPAGHYLVYKNGKVALRKYWEIKPQPPDAGAVAVKNLNTVADELYALLKESVKLRLISDVPLGAFLSGGIDSSAIVGLMRELGAEPLRTFSIGFEEASYDELGHARRVARLFSTEHEEFVIRPKALELTEKLIRHLDEPLGDFSIFPTYLVSQMARSRVKVILSGDGGDELFAGYEHYQAQKIAGNPLARAGVGVLSPFIRSLPPAEKKKGSWNKLQRFVQGFDHSAKLRHLRWMIFLSRRDKEKLYTAAMKQHLGGLREINEREPFRGVMEEAARFDSVTGELYLDLKTYLADDIMVKVDRMSMAPSLEAREPLLDHKLVEFVFGLAGSLKLRGLTTKWVFKKAMERLLPRETIHRPKEGFSIPIKHWLRNELRELMLDHLSEKRIRETGLFKYQTVQKMTEAHLSGRKNYSHQLWALMVFEIWKENYL